jgi:hypothetical protein
VPIPLGGLPNHPSLFDQAVVLGSIYAAYRILRYVVRR